MNESRNANRALRQLPEAAALATQRVMEVSVFQVARDAQRHAPEASGHLRRSIQWARRRFGAVVGVDRTAYYWRFVEYGTVRHPPQPFLRPAALRIEGDHQKRLEQALAKANRETLG